MRSFVFGDQSLAAGDAFEWRKLGVPEGKVFELWKACYLDVDYGERKPAEQPKPVEQPKVANGQQRKR